MAGRATLPRAAASGAMGVGGSGSGGSGSSFARLLASTRLASHTPAVPQVYTASKAHIGRGDFGLKRPLPSRGMPNGALRFIDVDALDTREGQTAWSEREHPVLIARRFKEMNVKLKGAESMSDMTPGELSPGHLGPRISTTYDPSTRRSVPTAYAQVPDASFREHLQNEARLGRGPVYQDAVHSGQAIAKGLDRQGPFGSAAVQYTHTESMPIDYRAMDEKTFERFLDYLRQQRPAYKRHTSSQELLKARRELVKRYNEERQALLRVALQQDDREAALAKVPEPMTEDSIPLPDVSELSAGKDAVNVDMWDESRFENRSSSLCGLWLQDKDTERASKAHNERLPHTTTPYRGATVGASVHPQGGLQYGQPDAIQTQLMSDGLSGRILEKASDAQDASRQPHRRIHSRGVQGMHVAVGGHMAVLPLMRTGSPARQPIDWGQRDPKQGVVTVKPIGAKRSVGGSGNATEQRPITVWGGQSIVELNKSPSAWASVAKSTQDANKNSAGSIDALRPRSLPEQYGTLNIEVHGSEGVTHNNLARGQPGSQRWIAELDHKLGYRPGGQEFAPLDFASSSPYSAALATTRMSEEETNQALANRGRGLGASAMYNARERKIAQEHRERKQRLAQNKATE